MLGNPVLNLLADMVARKPRASDSLDAVRSIHSWINNDHLSGASRSMPSPISFETPVNLVVEATAKDELGVQISFGLRIPVKWASDSGDVGRSRSEATLVVFYVSKVDHMRSRKA
jgi:hypothetical protein